jgi:DNA-binding MarR family transcriptional regulator
MLQSAFHGSDPDPGVFDVELIDEVVHGRLRLGVLAALAEAGGASFPVLKARLKASDGNLSSHLRTLQEAGYVWIEKRFEGGKPVTRVVLSESGRQAFHFYLEAMARLVAEHGGRWG